MRSRRENCDAERKFWAIRLSRVGKEFEGPNLGLVFLILFLIEEWKDCGALDLAVKVVEGRFGNLHGETIVGS